MNISQELREELEKMAERLHVLGDHIYYVQHEDEAAENEAGLLASRLSTEAVRLKMIAEGRDPEEESEF